MPTVGVSTADEERVASGYAGRLSMIVSIGWLTVLLGREAIPPLLPSIISEFSMTPTQAGFGLTVMWAVYSLLHFPAGQLSDDISRTRVLQTSFVSTILGFVMLLVVTNYPGFLVGVALVGFGAGLYFTPARALVSDLFTEKRGQVLGIHSAAGMIGSALAAVLAIGALSVGRWRLAFIPVAPLLLIELTMLTRWSRETHGSFGFELHVRETLTRVFRGGYIRWLLIAYALFSFTWQAFITFLPTFLQVDKLISPTMAGAIYALLFVIASAIGPVAGAVADRISRIYVAVAGLLISVLGVTGLLLIESLPGLVAFTVLAAIGLRTFPPAMQAHVLGLFPDGNIGGDFGAMKSSYTGFGSLGPIYVGFMAENFSYTAAYWGLAACLLLSGVILFVIDRMWG